MRQGFKKIVGLILIVEILTEGHPVVMVDDFLFRDDRCGNLFDRLLHRCPFGLENHITNHIEIGADRFLEDSGEFLNVDFVHKVVGKDILRITLFYVDLRLVIAIPAKNMKMGVFRFNRVMIDHL